MLAESKISSKNQVTLPKVVMTRLGLRASDRIVFAETPDGAIRIRPKNKTLADLKYAFAHRGQPARTLEEMDQAIQAGSAPTDS